MNFTRKLREWQHQTWTQVSWKGQRNRTKCVISPWNKLLLAQRERSPNQTTRNKLEGRKNQSRSGPDGISHLRPGRPTNWRRRRRTRERDSYSVEEEWIPSIRFGQDWGGSLRWTEHRPLPRRPGEEVAAVASEAARWPRAGGGGGGLAAAAAPPGSGSADQREREREGRERWRELRGKEGEEVREEEEKEG